VEETQEQEDKPPARERYHLEKQLGIDFPYKPP